MIKSITCNPTNAHCSFKRFINNAPKRSSELENCQITWNIWPSAIFHLAAAKMLRFVSEVLNSLELCLTLLNCLSFSPRWHTFTNQSFVNLLVQTPMVCSKGRFFRPNDLLNEQSPESLCPVFIKQASLARSFWVRESHDHLHSATSTKNKKAS